MYTLLCVYSFALLKPIIPVVNDVFAHTFYKLEHLATVHYENGKYHLHTELEKQDSENTPLKNNSTKTSDSETLLFHLKNETDTFVIDRICVSQISFPYANIPVGISPKILTPPPQA